jgi:hypothetical protein
MIVAHDCMILHIFQISDGETQEVVTMDEIDRQSTEREAKLLQANREELVERIGRAMREDGTVQSLEGLHLIRLSSPRASMFGVMEPSLCVIARAVKRFFWARGATGTTPSITCSPPSGCPTSVRSWKHRWRGLTSVCASPSPHPCRLRHA